MNQEDLQKKQKKVMLYVMLVSLICIVGVSYAFFTAGLSSETSTTVRADAGTMKITYDGGANINLSGIYPRDEVWATKNITVTGNNTTDAEMHYKLTLVIDSNTFKTSDPLQYELVSTNTSTNGEIIPAISKTDITSSSIELGSGHFVKANNARHTYELKIYYPKKTTSQNDNQGASFSAHIEITPVKASSSSSAEIITFTLEGTEYQAEAGMTFEKWRDSKYNTFGYYYGNAADIAKTTIESNKTYVLLNYSGTRIAQAEGYIISNVNETNFKSKTDAQILYHLAANDYEFLNNFVNNIDNNNYTEEEIAMYEELRDKMEDTVPLGLFPLNLKEDTSASTPIQKTDDGKYVVTIQIEELQEVQEMISVLKVLYFNGKNLEIIEIPDNRIDYTNRTVTVELNNLSGFIFFYDKN